MNLIKLEVKIFYGTSYQQNMVDMAEKDRWAARNPEKVSVDSKHLKINTEDKIESIPKTSS